MSTPIRLAYLVSHPIQYQAPLLRRIAADPQIDLTVFFGSDVSIRRHHDVGFGTEIAWDTPLLDGYRYEFLPALRDAGRISATSPISRHLHQRLKAGHFDALWVHGYASINALQAICVARLLGIPVLVRAESWLADRDRSRMKLAAKRIFFRLLRSSVAAVLPIGTRNAAYWSHYLPGIRQFAMPYAVDNAWFAGQTVGTDTHKLRRELDLAAGRPVILFASKLQARKHADHLIEAYRALASSAPKTPYLLIAGEGEERFRLEELSADLEGVRFLGFRNQTELPGLFALADVFVLPSRHEPWGLVVNEAMASGCAVVVSEECGCQPDLITGKTGLSFRAGEIDALASVLERVLADCDRMGRASQQRMAMWSFEQDLQGLRDALAYVTSSRAR